MKGGKTEAVDIRKHSLWGNFGKVWFLCFFACFYRLKFDLRTADWALGIYFLITHTYSLQDGTAHSTACACCFSFFQERDSQKHSTQSHVFQICSTLQEPGLTVRDLRRILDSQPWGGMSGILNQDLLFRLMIITSSRKLGKSDQSLSEFNDFHVWWTLTDKRGIFYCRFFFILTLWPMIIKLLLADRKRCQKQRKKMNLKE